MGNPKAGRKKSEHKYSLSSSAVTVSIAVAKSLLQKYLLWQVSGCWALFTDPSTLRELSDFLLFLISDAWLFLLGFLSFSITCITKFLHYIFSVLNPNTVSIFLLDPDCSIRFNTNTLSMEQFGVLLSVYYFAYFSNSSNVFSSCMLCSKCHMPRLRCIWGNCYTRTEEVRTQQQGREK